MEEGLLMQLVMVATAYLRGLGLVAMFAQEIAPTVYEEL